MNKPYNFNAGPAGLPLEVLLQARDELLDFRGTGLSVTEISHRSKQYEEINFETQQLLQELLDVPSGYEVLFLQGGASTQFAMVPINFLTDGRVAGYIHSGTWSGKAIAEAGKVGKIVIAASSEADRYKKVPEVQGVSFRSGMAYVHLTSNETIAGIQYRDFPDTGDIPLIADMSSDILSRTFEVSNFALIYAGAQKNMGPSGVTVIIIRRDLLDGIPDNIPDILNYRIHAKNRSLFHTPPVFSVYMVNLVLKWIRNNGGVEGMERRNRLKADLVYGAIDDSGGFFGGLADRNSRSMMNVTFRVYNDEQEKLFLRQAELNGFVGLKGHRDAGHLRASLYNAVTYEQCKALADFMRHFQQSFG
ncbi:3-phosphoserine/phosphohydroxythreonine transaminase [Paenibacillus hamazuiensis]|uniref:3-phosphoserine/phosphohydroxythreonine transaminase n=1 Tax=Paenibacillus hamazuiensis TaxID=2936508 RepID=UPI00200F8945|nr:3-phosphoserine/phosphohydroxythreonine transaminase [Paenibacillus hamazuiensis]